MDRDHLTRLIDDPKGMRREDIADLKAMAQRYPWFSGAHLLLAVGGHREGDVLFDEQLRASAAHLPSRTVLFDMINAPVAAVPHPEPLLRVVHTVVEAAPAEEPMSSVVPIVPAPSLPPPEFTPAAATVPEPTPDIPTSGSDALDRQIRAAAIAGSFELLIEHTPTLPATEVLSERRDTPPAVTPTIPLPGKLSFNEWLALGQERQPTDPAANARHDHAAAGTDTQERLRNVPAQAEGDPDTKSLINLFVQQSLATKPAKRAGFFNPQQAAKRSLEDHADLVTETLARIYAQQGNFAKAIAAYQRLAVKHPDRSGYFLDQARALEG